MGLIGPNTGAGWLPSRGLLLVVALSALGACARVPPTSSAGLKPCHIVYDAGSSGTRLYIYAREGEAWIEHAGPTTDALADPVRQHRGKTWDDAGAVVGAIVGALDGIQQDGPPDEDGKPEWPAFRWETQCMLESASVYATAGMRLAEYQDRSRSTELWRELNRRLKARLGASVPVQTRTLTGFEEGLFAWLAARDDRRGDRVGIVEMGGASAQITFPCAGCDPTNDAVRTISIGGRKIRIYSYSFLGAGQDEAALVYGVPGACAWVIGVRHSDWQESDCAAEIPVRDIHGIHDPYDFDDRGRFIHATVPVDRADVDEWLLTGAFTYMKPSDVDEYCRDKVDSYYGKNACFVWVYRRKWLGELGVPVTSEALDVKWTYGAVLCADDDCLGGAPPPACRWSPQGCLSQTGR